MKILKILKRWRARYRASLGLCPECNSDAPEIDCCRVCNEYRGRNQGRPAVDGLFTPADYAAACHAIKQVRESNNPPNPYNADQRFRYCETGPFVIPNDDDYGMDGSSLRLPNKPPESELAELKREVTRLQKVAEAAYAATEEFQALRAKIPNGAEAD